MLVSLCNTLYKLVAKILSNRMKPTVPFLMYDNQYAFVQDRNISKNILLAQEIIHFMQKASSKRGLLMVKVDIERAYDRIRWDFCYMYSIILVFMLDL